MNSNKSKKEIIELILAVKNGDQKAFVSLLQQYSPLIEATVNSFCSDELSANDKDDFRQEATVAFYNFFSKSIVKQIIYITFHKRKHSFIYVLGTLGEIILHAQGSFFVINY